jgi:hypothetical protein
MKSLLDTRHRQLLRTPDGQLGELFQPLLDLWFTNRGAGDPSIPDYAAFDVLDLPTWMLPCLFVCKLIGQPRRFFYELVGDAIEQHNGFSAQKRYLADIPLKNKQVMAREFAATVFNGCPIYSQGPYVGFQGYVKEVERLICPYRLTGNTYAFVGVARLTIQTSTSQHHPVGFAYPRQDRHRRIGPNKTDPQPD